MTGRKLGLKSTVWTSRKKETFNQNKNEEIKIQNIRRDLGTSLGENSGTSLNIPTSES